MNNISNHHSGIKRFFIPFYKMKVVQHDSKQIKLELADNNFWQVVFTYLLISFAIICSAVIYKDNLSISTINGILMLADFFTILFVFEHVGTGRCHKSRIIFNQEGIFLTSTRQSKKVRHIPISTLDNFFLTYHKEVFSGFYVDDKLEFEFRLQSPKKDIEAFVRDIGKMIGSDIQADVEFENHGEVFHLTSHKKEYNLQNFDARYIQGAFVIRGLGNPAFETLITIDLPKKQLAYKKHLVMTKHINVRDIADFAIGTNFLVAKNYSAIGNLYVIHKDGSQILILVKEKQGSENGRLVTRFLMREDLKQLRKILLKELGLTE